MNAEQSEQLANKAAQIAKEIAQSLKQFNKETAMLLYAKQWNETPVSNTFPEDTGHKKGSNEEATRKLDKMMKDARLKWDYATESDKRKVAEMEKIVTEGQERIKALYKMN